MLLCLIRPHAIELENIVQEACYTPRFYAKWRPSIFLYTRHLWIIWRPYLSVFSWFFNRCSAVSTFEYLYLHPAAIIGVIWLRSVLRYEVLSGCIYRWSCVHYTAVVPEIRPVFAVGLSTDTSWSTAAVYYLHLGIQNMFLNPCSSVCVWPTERKKRSSISITFILF